MPDVGGSEIFAVSPELTVVVGAGAAPPLALGPQACALVFAGPDGSAPDRVVLAADASAAGGAGRRLVLVLARAAWTRLGGRDLAGEPQGFHLPSGLREVAAAVLAPGVPEGLRLPYRAAKSIELLCETLRRHGADELVPLAADGALSADDTRRVLAARRLVDERCGEKLTLDSIARSCGLNRSKLTRGFRDLFGCSVAEALTERRLERAGRMLLTTDMPIACVGHRAGYNNNASFARAFGRRFGRTPSDYRAGALADAPETALAA